MTRPLRPLLPALALALATPMASGQGQKPVPATSAETLNAEALKAMEANQWEEALKLFDRCIELHGRDALKKFGPSFGVTWYRKGVCEQQLKRLDAAAKSFETCYRDFPNKGKSTGNTFHKRALVRWAETAQAADQPAEAIRLFKKYLEERDRQKDPFEPGSYYLQIALCHLKLGDVALGAENLETAIRNKNGFGSPDQGIVAGLQALVATAIAKKDENTLLAFLKGNRGALMMEPSAMAGYSAEFVKLATDAISADMTSAGLSLFQLLPASELMEEDLRAKLAMLGNPAELETPTGKLVKTELEARLAAVEKASREGTCHEVLQLEATAAIHEKSGNLRGASAAFGELAARFPKATRRADYLFHQIRTAAGSGEASGLAELANKFCDEFPESAKVGSIKRLILVSLFEKGDFDACIKAASDLLPKLQEGSQEHDVCLRLLAASYEQKGQFNEAKPLLERHVTLYPGSAYAQSAQYLQAANLVKLEQWGEAAKLLDTFISKYPDAAANPHLAAALLDRAECHAAKGEEKEALEQLARLEKDFPGSETLANAQGLKGDLLLRKGDSEGGQAQAEDSLKKALAQAEKLDQREAAAEILLRLVNLLAKDPKRSKEAQSYCDRFWKGYEDLAPLSGRMALAQAEVFAAAGRNDEAAERLAKELGGRLANPTSSEAEAIARAYAKLYARAHGLEELKRHLAEFPGLKPEDKPARAMLRIAVIEAVEEQLDSSDAAAKTKADTLIKALYQELKAEFETKDLPPAILVRTGDYLRTRTSAPRQALPYYEEALARKDAVVHFPALLGKAAVQAEGSKEERTSAIQGLQEVFAGSKDAGEREQALFWLVMTRMKHGDFAAAGESALSYLAPDSGFQHFIPEVRLALARSYQERNMVNEALAAHAKVWTDFGAFPRVSVPAMRAWMQLSWTRQSPANGAERPRSDRQAAYEEGLAFLERTRPLFDKMASVDQEAWLEIEKITTEFAATTDVKPVARPQPQGK
ncbi:tetratricopeptide repeat protein [Haloferula sp. BvORR071]|uniref:tetratricopeptide repeat protein n=1 Tax=Haloferula sp. BvORR071 TaxID=1396141 RepID=UPI00054E95C7|nr:tetratricopeptide repeat protein [Haloferula sp. BvORR071]